MGLTIHYKAKLKPSINLKEMIAELEDISQTMDWEYACVDETINLDKKLAAHVNLNHWSEELRLEGIIMKLHVDSEPFYMTFLGGKLIMPVAIRFLDPKTDAEYFWGAFTKTQFAGPKVHMAIVKLLKYLGSKYIDLIQVLDEAKYYDQMDELALQQSFEIMNGLLDQVDKALSPVRANPNESTADLMVRLEEILMKMRKDTNEN